MNKKTKIAIFVFIMITLLTFGYFMIIKPYIPIEEIQNENIVLNSTLNDTTLIDTMIIEMLPIDSNIYEFVEDTLFYVVVGSFKIKMNALNFNDVIEQSSIVYNDSYHMVYIYKTDDLKDAINIKISNKDKYDGVWIYKNIE